MLDAGSRDRTVAFACSAGARVTERPWTNFLDARRYALAQVETPWTLMIDADEALDDVLRDAIVSASGDSEAYVMRRTTYFCGKPMRIWRDEPLVRLFKTGRAVLEAHPAFASGAALHEAWRCDGPVGELRGTLLHYSYADAASYRAKYDRYTSLEAASLRGSLLRTLGAYAGVAVRFAWLLFGRGAILDGPRGWYVAYHSAAYPAVAARKALRA